MTDASGDQVVGNFSLPTSMVNGCRFDQYYRHVSFQIQISTLSVRTDFFLLLPKCMELASEKQKEMLRKKKNMK